MPGDTCLAAVTSGATVTLTGPGETVTILLARAGWIRCSQPAGAIRTAADRQCSAITTIRVEGLSGELWIQRRAPGAAAPPPTAAPSWTRAPAQGPAPDARGPEASDAEAWLRLRLCLPRGASQEAPCREHDAATTAADAAILDLGGPSERIPPPSAGSSGSGSPSTSHGT